MLKELTHQSDEARKGTTCTPHHTPGREMRFTDPDTGRVFYRTFCKHCGQQYSDILSTKFRVVH